MVGGVLLGWNLAAFGECTTEASKDRVQKMEDRIRHLKVQIEEERVEEYIAKENAKRIKDGKGSHFSLDLLHKVAERADGTTMDGLVVDVG